VDPTVQIYYARDLFGSNVVIQVMPDICDFFQSENFGSALSLATSGLKGVFFIQARDRFKNKRSSGEDAFVAHVRHLSILGSHVTSKAEYLSDGKHEIGYIVTIQGAYWIDVIYGSSVIQHSMTNLPGFAEGNSCVANSEYLSISTAGHVWEFSIQSKDSYRNSRTISGENWYVLLQNRDGEEHNVKIDYMGGSYGLAHGLGKHKGLYRTTKSGAFSLSISLVQKKGLLRTIYSDTYFTVPKEVMQVDRIEINWGTAGPLSNLSLFSDYFAAKFSGFLKSDSSGVHTFFATVADDGEDAALRISNAVVFDSVLHPQQSEFSGTIDLISNLLYPIELLYSETVGSASVVLHWQKNGGAKVVVPDHVFFSDSTSISGSPFTVTVFPAMVCGTLSTASGNSLSIVTAGMAASFTITSKDYMGNRRTDSKDEYIVFTRANSAFPTLNIDNLGTVVPQGNGEYMAAFQANWKQHSHGCVEETAVEGCVTSSEPWPSVGTATHSLGHPFHDLHVQQLFRGGLMATYYADSASTIYTPKKVVMLSAINFSCSSPSNIVALQAVSALSIENVKIVVEGFIDVLTSYFDVSLRLDAANNYMKKGDLYLDNFQIIKFPSINSSRINFHKKIYTVKLEIIQSKTSPFCSSVLGFPSALNSSSLMSGHALNFKISDEGSGLSATYYSDTLFSRPLVSYMNGELPMWNGTNVLSRPHPEILPIGNFSVRWRGFLKITKEGLYTFSMLKGSTSESFKLVLDGIPLLDSALGATMHTQSGTYFLPANYEQKYDIDITYASIDSSVPKAVWTGIQSFQSNSTNINDEITEPRLVSSHVTRNDEAAFDWKNGCTGLVGSLSRWKCRGRGTRRNQNPVMRVLSNDANSAFSSASGRQLTITTAGLDNYFTVTLRDRFRNQIDDHTIVSAFLVEKGSSRIIEIADIQIENERGPGLLATYYNDFRSTNQMMLTASYYNSPYMIPQGQRYTKKQSLFAFDISSLSYPENMLEFDGKYAVSMKGFVRAPSSGSYSIEYMCNSSTCEDVMVWIDDNLVLTRLTPKLSSFNMERHMFYEIRVLHMSSKPSPIADAFRLQFSCKFTNCLNITNGDIFPHSNDNYKKSPLGQYQGHYRYDKSGSFDMSAALAGSDPGVRACFYINPNITKLVRCLLWNEVSFDFSNSSPIDGIANDNIQWSASLEGWYKPEKSENATLLAESNGRFELYFDRKNCSTPCDLFMNSMKHYFFQAFVYPTQVCETNSCHFTRISTFKMFLKYLNGDKKAMSPARFSADVQYVSVTALNVFPARECATTSSVHGTCLSLVTAGIMSTLTIQIRDQFLNHRSQENDLNYVVEVSIKKFPVSNEPSDFAACVPSGKMIGQHLCSYAITRAQASMIDVYLNFESGLEATYYDEHNFLNAKSSYNQHDIAALRGSKAPAELTNDGKWSAHFEGSIRSPRTAIISFTADCETDEWASVDIDGMTLLHTLDGVRTRSMYMRAEKFYKILIRYSSSGNASWFFSLYGNMESASTFGPVQKYRLYNSKRSKGSPFISEVRVAVACSSKSLSEGMGITLSTAGLIAVFKITSRDEFSNIRSLSCLKCQDTFYVRLMGCGRVPPTSFSEYPPIACPDCINCPILVRAANLSTANSAVYENSYTPTKTGSYRAVASLANDAGVLTSFFENKLQFCVNQLECNSGDQKFTSKDVDFSSTGTFAGKTLSSFAFRWRGLIQSRAAKEYTFSVSTVNDSATSATLWIDNQIVLSSSPSAKVYIGTISLPQEFNFYDFQLIYVAEYPSASAGLTLKWKGDQSSFEVIPTNKFFLRQDLPIRIIHTVQPTLQSPKTAYAYGPGLTIATSGAKAIFSVALRDQFQNNRLTANIGEITSEIRGSVGLIESNVAVTLLSENKVQVEYTISKASSFDLIIRQLGIPIFDSPFPLIVTASLECATKSFALGTGLSSSIVNSMSTFTVQVRDAFGNLKISSMSTSGSCQAIITVDSILLHTGEVNEVTLSNVNIALCKNVAVMFFGGTLSENGFHAEAAFDSNGVLRFLGKGKYANRVLPFALKGKPMNSMLISKISYTSNGPIFETSGSTATQIAANSITLNQQLQLGVVAVLLQPITNSPGQYFSSYQLTSKPTPPMKAFVLPYLLNKGGLIATYYTLANLITSQNFNNLAQATPCHVTFAEQSVSNIPTACGATGPYGIRYFGFIGFSAASVPANVMFTVRGTTASYVRMFWRTTPANLKTSLGVPLGNTWTSLSSDPVSKFEAQSSWSSTRTTGYDDFVVEIRGATMLATQNGFPETSPAQQLHAPWPLASSPSSLTVLDNAE
jgi:hypothetical protein